MSSLVRALAHAMIGLIAVWASASTACAQPSPSPDEIHRKTQEVFQRPEFQKTEISGFWIWLARQLASFFQWLGGLQAGAPALFWLILVSCVVLLIAIITLMVFQVRAAFAGGGRRRREAAEQTTRLRLSDEYHKESARLAAAGDYTEAIRCLFLSLVYRFDERGRVNFHKEYTNREYLELMSDRTRDALRVLVDILDDNWYGQRPSLRQQYVDSLAVYERLSWASP